MPELERPRSLAAIVTDHIREMIVNGDVPLGASLSERSIATDLNVSKTPVRDALAQLRGEGLVSIFPQSGVRVFTLSAREVRDICTFRRKMEAAALELCFEFGVESLQTDLERIVARMHAATVEGNTREYLRLDTDFHLTFFQHCQNSYLQSAYAQFSGKIAALRTHLAQKPRHTALSLQEHGEIVGAIAERDLPRLKDILHRHIGRTEETYQIEVEDIARADQGG